MVGHWAIKKKMFLILNAMIRCPWCIEWKACITNRTFGTNVIIVHMVTMTYEDPLLIESWQSKTSEMISSQWCYNYYFPKLSFFFFSLLKPHMFGNETITRQKDFTLWKLIGIGLNMDFCHLLAGLT